MRNQIKADFFKSERIMKSIFKATNLISFKFNLKFQFLCKKL